MCLRVDGDAVLLGVGVAQRPRDGQRREALMQKI